MVNFAKAVLPSDAECASLLSGLNQGPATAGELIKSMDPARQAFVFRSINWLLKLGILKVMA